MSIISPLAFGILAVMKWMYFVIPNYGVVIIILVLLMRLVLHPVTRHGQIAMSKMSKLAPRAEEIKKKYGANKTEMNKKLMELYREQGASPIMGFVPMFIQIPIWVALWSAIYTSVSLRAHRSCRSGSRTCPPRTPSCAGRPLRSRCWAGRSIRSTCCRS